MEFFISQSHSNLIDSFLGPEYAELVGDFRLLCNKEKAEEYVIWRDVDK